MKIGRDCDCNCDHDNGHAADKDEFISDVTTFLSSLQPLFETGCEKSCIPGLQSSGSEKILALDASNYEDMTLQFQNLLEKVHHYKLLKSAQLSKETESDGRVNNSMTAAVALTALNKFAQSQHQRTKKDQTKSTELKLSKQDHKEDRNMEINMPMSIPVSTFSHENQNPQSESCMQRRKLARQYTREQKKLQKQKGGGSLHADEWCMIYRHDDESEEDDDVNGETNDTSSAGDLSSRKRKLEDMTKTSTGQNVYEDRAMGNNDDNNTTPRRRKDTEKFGKKRVRLEIDYKSKRGLAENPKKDDSVAKKSNVAVPISIRPNDKQKVQVGNYRPVSNSLENNCSDKSKKVDQQNNHHHKSTGLATGIELPHDHDVISGKRKYSNHHPGNHRFRNIICKIKKEFEKSTLDEKKKYAQDVVDKIKCLNPPGRFLRQDITCVRRSWYELCEKDTLIKTRQAFRESWSNHPIEKEKAMKKKSILRRVGCLEEQVEERVKDVNTIEQEAIPKKSMDGLETYNETYKQNIFLEGRKDHQQPQKCQQHQKQSLMYQQHHRVHNVAMHFKAILPRPN